MAGPELKGLSAKFMLKFFHSRPDAKELFETLAAQKGLPPAVVEKDYWVMHCLWGLNQLGLHFEMKGGTSLSKGWRVIERFSEDIDIRFEPPSELSVKGDKPAQVVARFKFYDALAVSIKIPGVTAGRNRVYDDEKAQKEREATRKAGLEVDRNNNQIIPKLLSGKVLCFPNQAQFHPGKYLQ